MMESPVSLGRTILVPLDGSSLAERTIPYVQALAEPGARVVLLHVLPPPEPVRNPDGGVAVPAEDVLARCRQAAQRNLDEVAARLRCASGGLTVDIALTVGDPADQIVRVATERHAELIAMTTRGRSGDDELAFSGVVDRVARSTDIPTLIVRPLEGRTESFPVAVRRLVVPLDGSETSAQALPFARTLARWLGVSLNLICVIDPVREAPPALAYETGISSALFNELFAGRILETQQMLERIGAGLMRDRIPTTWAMLAGPTVSCISEATRPGDLVVMTSHGRSGPARWPIGSTAEALIRHCTAPVVLLRAQSLTPVAVRVVGSVPELVPDRHRDRSLIQAVSPDPGG
jgi:nucleotide-binding universal stress UspA family protein